MIEELGDLAVPALAEALPKTRGPRFALLAKLVSSSPKFWRSASKKSVHSS